MTYTYKPIEEASKEMKTEYKEIKEKNKKKSKRKKSRFTDFQRKKQALLYKDLFIEIYSFFNGLLFQQQLITYLEIKGIDKPYDILQLWEMFNLIEIKKYVGRNYIYLATFTIKAIGIDRAKKINTTTKKLEKQCIYNEYKLLTIKEGRLNEKSKDK